MNKRDREPSSEPQKRRRKPGLKGASDCLDAVDTCLAYLPDMYDILLRKNRRKRQLEELRKLYDGRHEWALAF